MAKLLVSVGLVLASCTHSAAPRGAAPTAPAPSVTALPDPGQRCGALTRGAKAVWFRAADGTVLDGAAVGTGRSGVVLAHEYPADLCGWWPFATHLARHGFRVLAFDFRCFGLSTCPRG